MAWTLALFWWWLVEMGGQHLQRRWALRLEGHRFDLDDLELLCRGDGTILTEPVNDLAGHARLALFASAFDDATTPTEVNDRGKVLLDRLNGILFVREPGREPITMDAVPCWQDAKPPLPAGYVGHGFLAGHVKVRSRARGTLTDAGEDQTPSAAPRPSEAAWLSESFDDPALEDVLTYLRGLSDWFDLWKAFEIMRADIRHRSGEGWERSGVAWPNETDVRRFCGSVNYHRHSRVHSSWRMEAAKRMSLEEAQRFLSGLVVPWQAWKHLAGSR